MINNTKYRIRVIKSIEEHFNRPHIGVSILSMSKRIMNEVMCLAEDNKLVINYQDTDSMHILESHLPILIEKFSTKYNKDLVGDCMGQFHSDFDFEYHDINGEKQTAKNIISVESEYLGKKCYHDELRGEDKSGNFVYGNHTRLKGVSGDAIEHYSDNNNLQVKDLYNTMLNGNNIHFDLLCKDENGYIVKDRFVRNKNKTISNKTEFIRNIQFNRIEKKVFADLL